MQTREGQKVPSVVFRTRQDSDWRDVSSEEIFGGKTVAVFSLPGAFTPTCSSSHVPRYSQLAAEFAKHGVDEIVCVSVNDAFVMSEWQRSQNADNITFLLLSAFRVLDYDSVMPHPALEGLRFKVEASGGAKVQGRVRLMAAVNMLAFYYLDEPPERGLKPFVEAGIGVVYTDFRVEGQGLKVNFNPQAGFGLELPPSLGGEYFLTFRVHHISNGGLDDENRGINSVAFVIGKYF